MQTIFEVLFFVLDIVWVIVIIHAVMSWLVGFNVVSLRQPFVGQIWYSLEQLLQPIYSKIRQFLPGQALLTSRRSYSSSGFTSFRFF